MRKAGWWWALALWPRLGLALTPTNETVPDRPVVLEDGDIDLYGDFGLSLVDNPAGWVHVGDRVVMPAGIDMGVGGIFELGARVGVAARPKVVTSWELHGRLRPTSLDWLAVGGSLVLPFGLATDRLGPDGVGFAFDVPVVRYERARAAVQASLRWDLGFYRGSPVRKGLEYNVTGVGLWARDLFAVLDVSSRMPDYRPDFGTVAMAVGIGHRPAPGIWVKVQAQTGDLVDGRDWTVLFTLVNRWEDPRKSIIPR